MGRKKIFEPTIMVRVGNNLLAAVGVGSEQDVSLRSTNPVLVAKAKLAARLGKRHVIFNGRGVADEIAAGYGSPEEIQAMLLAVSDEAILVPADEDLETPIHN